MMSVNSTRSSRVAIIVGVLVTLLLAGLSIVAVGFVGGGLFPGSFAPGYGVACVTPATSGTVVNVTLTNTGGPMMGRSNGMMSGGAMRLTADRSIVVHGPITFVATNSGSLTHEMVILALPNQQIAGTRPIGGDGKVDETGSLGEASTSCGQGAGEGILPGSSSWASATLPPGRYEVICDLPGHYAAGMYTQLTVT